MKISEIRLNTQPQTQEAKKAIGYEWNQEGGNEKSAWLRTLWFRGGKLSNR